MGTHQEIFRGPGTLNLMTSNSRVVEVDEKTGKILSRTNSAASLETFEPEHTLQRGLKSRQVQLIAIAGAIGTGLFLGSGSTLAQTGPASLVLSYIVLGSVVYFVMHCVAEMIIYRPLPGKGVVDIVGTYLSPSISFAIGWNYWYAFSILIAAEVTAAGAVFQYWVDVNVAAPISVLLVIVIAMNAVSVRVFGEAEFWFGLIKLIALMGLIILAIVLFFGGGPKQHGVVGFRYWKKNAFKAYLVKDNLDLGRFLGFWTAIVKSGFSYIFGPEMIATCLGETENPRKNGIKASKRFIWRLLFFYVLGSLGISVIVSSSDKKLFGSASDAKGSPWVIGIQNAGIPVLNHIINAVILTSACSAANSFLYTATRMLFSMAERGNAPKIFARVNRWGIPYYSLAASSALGFLAYLNCSSSASNVFSWLSNLTTTSGFISWIAICFAFIRFRKACKVHDCSDRVPYKTYLGPFGAYYVIVFMTLLTLTNGYPSFVHGFSGADFVAAYVTLPIVFGLYVVHRAYDYFKNHNKHWLNPIEDIDMFSGLDLIEAEERNFVEPVPKNALQKFWYWVA
ncbi:uncharacterized protein LODBEIA_P12820 [Lodderomyces beijingensis]|uniref:Amino acid permease/ SLC12A domain-containing protein n=1 Tax=Lodderomyces beijingensis TaxID=1775926 RepID=A0ABP0ZFW3_9ASCO